MAKAGPTRVEVELLARVGDNEPRTLGTAVVEVPIQVARPGADYSVSREDTKRALEQLLREVLAGYHELDHGLDDEGA